MKPSWNTATLIHVHIVSVCTGNSSDELSWQINGLQSLKYLLSDPSEKNICWPPIYILQDFFLCICVNICVCVVFRQCSHFVCFLNLLFWENIMLTSNFCWVPFLFLFHWIKIWEPLLSVLCLYYVSPLGVTWE